MVATHASVSQEKVQREERISKESLLVIERKPSSERQMKKYVVCCASWHSFSGEQASLAPVLTQA